MSVSGEDEGTRAYEYVLGLLPPDEAAAVESDMERDAALSAAVMAAQQSLAALDDTAAPVAPSRELWERIEREAYQSAPVAVAVDPVAGADAGAIPASATPPSATPPRATPATRPPVAARRWRVAAAAGFVAAALLAMALFWSLFLRFDPVVIAALVDDQGELVALVESSRDNRVKVTVLDDVALAGDRIMQVWTKPDPDGPPVSIGIIEEVASKTLDLAGYPPPSSDQLYEITIEREGGSPTGLPTGPILGKGFAQVPR